MVENDESRHMQLNRRRFIELSGAAGAISLAGCADLVSNEGDGTDGGGGDGSGARHVSMTNKIPAELQWNNSNPSTRAEISRRAIFDRFVAYNIKTGEFEGYAISDWSHGGNTFELTVREDLTWENGDDVTAEDVATQLNLGLKTGASYAGYTESIEATDDTTVTFTFNSELGEQIPKYDILAARYLHQKASEFGKFLDQIEEDEEAGLQALTEFAYSEPIASGPWTIESKDQQQLLLKKRDDHPDAGNINFDEYVFKYYEDNNSVYQALKNDEIDSAFNLYAPPDVVESFPENFMQVQTPGAWGYGLVPNHDHQHMGDRAVRQAIQYVINRKQVVNNVSAASKSVPPYPVGIPSSKQEQWIGDHTDAFDDYGADTAATEKATEVLENAGYAQQDGNWVDSDGNVVEVPIVEPSGWNDWNDATKTIVDQLSSFGFAASSESRDYGTLTDTVWPNSDFAITTGGWLDGVPQGVYPYFSLHHQLVKNSRGFSYNYPAADTTRGGDRGDVTVPAMDGSGEQTINPSDRLDELAVASDEATINEITVELAWVTNQDLPMLPVMEKMGQSFIDAEGEWSMPDEGTDSLGIRYPNTWLPRTGDLEYKG
ncbi:ABC transporter substrate-binding protein [Halocatena halophila]|uniref:ABC transporter substrate-binding protein n=1 Tax=Halocatena halophila TaxID=2814576 RepID=UPI002ED5B1A0